MTDPLVVQAAQLNRERGLWDLALGEEQLQATRQGEASETFSCSRAEIAERGDVVDGLIARRTVTTPPPKRLLQLDVEGFEAFKRWMGPDARLRIELRRRFSWALPLGVLMMFGSLPMDGDPAAGIDPVPFDWVGAMLGVLLVATGFLAKRRPDHNFLLADSGWFLVLAGVAGREYLRGGSIFWVFLILLDIWLVYRGIKLWLMFRDELSRQDPAGRA